MKKNILKIIAVALIAVIIYFGWNTYQKYSKFGELVKDLATMGESISEKLTNSPIVSQELYSADSTLKVGVYRFLVPGDGSFEASPYQASLIDTSTTYPKSGNIFSDVETRPVAKWISADSILVKADSMLTEDYDSIKRLQGIIVLVKE